MDGERERVGGGIVCEGDIYIGTRRKTGIEGERERERERVCKGRERWRWNGV